MTSGPDLATIIRIARAAHAHGVRSFRLTGGEPSLRRDLPEIVACIKALPDTDVSCISNGVKLTAETMVALKRAGLDQITISLDTTRSDRFASITAVDGFSRVTNALDYARKCEIPARINCVLLKGINDDEILDLIRFAGSKGASIKFLDLFDGGKDVYGGHGSEYWKRHYYDSRELKKLLKEISEESGVVPAVGNTGSPMASFRVDGTDVLALDGNSGTNYGALCKTCPLFPCQTGFLSFIVTADATIKFCDPPNTPILDLSDALDDEAKLIERFAQAFEMMADPEFAQRWSPAL